MKSYIVLVILLVAILLTLWVSAVNAGNDWRSFSEPSPVGTAIDAPTPTDCPRCIPVGTPERP